jgi:hypothetical protein
VAHAVLVSERARFGGFRPDDSLHIARGGFECPGKRAASLRERNVAAISTNLIVFTAAVDPSGCSVAHMKVESDHSSAPYVGR